MKSNLVYRFDCIPNREDRYGVFRKNSNKLVVRTETREEAEKLVKYNYIECEVRAL